jgi:RHS repeat-associated protein
VGGVTPTYDGNGNLTSDGTYPQGYDAENRLASTSGAGNAVTSTFDAQGRRKSRMVNGTVTWFVTDADDREVLEYGAGGAILNWYAYGLGSNALARMEVGAGTRTTFVPDLLGSTVATIASATGALAKIGYLPYGAGNTAAPFGFTGLRIDLESGDLYYARARHYSQMLGRFLQPDPGDAGGINLYAHTDNHPLNRTDRGGRWWTGSGRGTAGDGREDNRHSRPSRRPSCCRR